MKCLLLVLTLSLVSFCSFAQADIHLLGSPQVRAELRIPHPLALRIIHNLNESARLQSGGFMSREHARKLQEERERTPPETLTRQIMNWLSPAQKQRLEQIALQRGGPFLFEDWRFAQRVGLSLRQHQKLQPTFRAAFERYVRGVQSLSKANKNWFGILDRQKYASQYAAYARQFSQLGQQRKTAVEWALDRSLTRQQKANWRTLLGKPFRARLTYDTQSYPMD